MKISSHALIAVLLGLFVSQTSFANRSGKMAQIYFESGLNPAPFPSAGLGGSFFLSPDLLIDGSYVSGGISIDDVEVSWSMLEVRGKFFLGNSFYLTGGLGQRTFKFDTSVLNATLGGSNIALEAEASSLGFTFALGNQWHWDGFTLGCDWFGMFQVLSASGDSELTNASADPAELADLNDTIEKLSQTGNSQLLRLYLGWAF